MFHMSKIHVKALYFSLSLCFAMSSLSQSLNWQTFHNAEYGYSIEFPDTWQVIELEPRTEDTPRGTTHFLMNGELQGVTFMMDDDPLAVGILEVRVISNPEKLDISRWADETFIDAFDSSLAYNFEPDTLGGKPATRFTVFEFDQTGAVVAAMVEDRIYYVHFASSNPNDEDFEEHKKIYAHMVSSFRFIAGDDE